MKPDRVMQEIRKVRDRIARDNGFDPNRIFADLKASEAKRSVAKAPAKKPKPTPRRRKAA